jgi:hypothetical protein
MASASSIATNESSPIAGGAPMGSLSGRPSHALQSRAAIVSAVFLGSCGCPPAAGVILAAPAEQQHRCY